MRDSVGYEYDLLRPNAWRYRDYVIRALNQDKPYNRSSSNNLLATNCPTVPMIP
jgi:hypothetical protein